MAFLSHPSPEGEKGGGGGGGGEPGKKSTLTVGFGSVTGAIWSLDAVGGSLANDGWLAKGFSPAVAD